ncbi:MAG: MBL fold metallo-hydrolase [Oscillospiraceae bacterium]
MAAVLEPVKWMYQGGVCLAVPGFTLWVDPYELEPSVPKADAILVTHAHSDHYSPDDIGLLMQPGTHLFAMANVAEKMRTRFAEAAERLTVVEEGARYVLGEGMAFTAAPVDGKNHPRGSGFGPVVEMAGFTYYLSGDTDVLDKQVACDVLFCVCDGKYNMLPDALTRAPAEIKAMARRPKLVVPYHFANGDVENGPKLAEILNGMGIESQVLSKG